MHAVNLDLLVHISRFIEEYGRVAQIIYMKILSPAAREFVEKQWSGKKSDEELYIMYAELYENKQIFQQQIHE